MKKRLNIITLCTLIACSSCFGEPSPLITQQSKAAVGAGKCGWLDSYGNVLSNRTLYNITNIGNIYIPRDAKIGSVIGADWVEMQVNKGPEEKLYCNYRAALSTNVTSYGTVNNISVAGNRVPSKTVYKTNIPGVGVVFKTRNFDDVMNTTESGTPPFFPYTMRTGLWNAWTIPTILVDVLFVKIGDIPMGKNNVTVTANVITDGNGLTETFDVRATVIRSECSIPASSKAIEVKMGSISKNSLQAADSNARLNEFEIPLTNCIYGNYPTVDGNYFTSSFAYITVSGNSGSAILDSSNGIMGLNDKSTAKGVAIQILKSDEKNPLKLGVSTPIQRINDGDTSLKFNARYVKTSEAIEPGIANASATFTINYK